LRSWRRHAAIFMAIRLPRLLPKVFHWISSIRRCGLDVMQNALLAYATPIFFLLIFAEAWWARKQNRDLFEFSDSLTSISCGVFTVTLELFAKTFLLGLFILVEQRFALWHWPVDSWVTWLVFFVLLDFVYY